MASRAIYGKPGGGKSYLSVQWLVDELMSDSGRSIITNEKLLFEGMLEYLAERGRSDIDVYSRVRLIDREQVKEFWRFRTVDPAFDHRPLAEEEVKKGVRPEEGHFARGGVFYLLSELHRHMNSRQWMKTGPLLLDYITMHRHYGDDVVWVSQFPQNVDSQWREGITEDWTLVRNFGKEGFRGFRKGDYCEWRTYLEFDEKESLNCQASGTFKIEPNGIGKCYDTSDVGGKADKGKKKKGLHIWWLYGGALVAMVAVALGFMFVPGWLGRKMAGQSATVAAETKEKPARHASTSIVPPLVPVPPAQPTPTPHLVRVIAVPLKYSAADTVRAALMQDKQTVPGGEINVTPSADNTSLILTGDDPQAVVALAETVRNYDTRCALVSVHCVIARRQFTKGQQVGLFGFLEDVAHGSGSVELDALLSSLAVDLSTGVATMGGSVTARVALDAFVQFVATDASYDVMSHPTLVMLSGREAVFSSGRQIPVPTTTNTASGSQTAVDYKNAEFSFKVRPTVLADGRVHLEITQSNTDVLSTVIVAGSEVPTLSTQSLQSSVDLSDRQLLYLGGILIDTSSASNRGTPFLRKVPVLNLVFGRDQKSVERSELFVVVTAEVWRNGAGPVRIERAIPVKQRGSK